MLPDVWAVQAKSRNGQIVSVEDRHLYRVREQCFGGDAQQQTVRGGDTYFEVEPFPYCPPLIQGRWLVLSERKKSRRSRAVVRLHNSPAEIALCIEVRHHEQIFAHRIGKRCLRSRLREVRFVIPDLRRIDESVRAHDNGNSNCNGQDRLPELRPEKKQKWENDKADENPLDSGQHHHEDRCSNEYQSESTAGLKVIKRARKTKYQSRQIKLLGHNRF